MQEFLAEFSNEIESGRVRLWPNEIVLVEADGSVYGIAESGDFDAAAKILRQLC